MAEAGSGGGSGIGQDLAPPETAVENHTDTTTRAPVHQKRDSAGFEWHAPAVRRGASPLATVARAAAGGLALTLALACAVRHPTAPYTAPPFYPAPTATPPAAPGYVYAAPNPAGLEVMAGGPSLGSPTTNLTPEAAPAGGAAIAPTVPWPFQAPLPSPELSRNAPARRIANLSPVACRAELAKSGLPVERDRRPTPGVATATRVTGPFHGVRLVVPPKSSPYGVLDCRLALTLGRLAELLAERGIAAIRIDNTYRPRAHLPGSRRPSQHNYALAADVTAFVLADGRTLEVERDWPAAIGEPACGPEARLTSDSPEAVELRNLVCAIAAQGLFQHILTPNFDAAHRNHLHLDIQRDNPRGTIH
ncbi:MAG: extensin family protein [Polyangiaceae bacterium]|nr:extensin family protein [Polyangiaceae bacterium]